MELLISITIGMMLIGFGSIALNNFNEQQKIKAVSQEIMANLRLARNYAITEQFNSSVPSDKTDNNGNTDRVVVTINGGTMTAKSRRGLVDHPNDQTFFENNLVVKGINIVSSGDIEFSITEGRSIGETVPIVVSVSNSDLNIIKTIRIDESGLIYEE